MRPFGDAKTFPPDCLQVPSPLKESDAESIATLIEVNSSDSDPDDTIDLESVRHAPDIMDRPLLW